MRSWKLSEIAELVGGELVGSADPVITGAAGIEDATDGDLSFVTSLKLLAQVDQSKASALLIGPGMETERAAVRVPNPYEGFADFLKVLQIPLERVFPAGVHETAVIDSSADVSLAGSIGPYCVISAGCVVGAGSRLEGHVTLGPDVRIGQDCLIYAQVAIREGCQVGNRAILHSGTCIGADGFGFLPGKTGLKKIPQIGIVVLEDDVEVGSNTSIDRATTGRTVIGQGTKIDNLVQVGHNVRIGYHTVLCGQSGVAGSTTIGNGVAVGGNASIGDHINIGDGVQVAGKAGIISDVSPGETVFGTPAVDIKESFRLFASLRKLPELLRRVRKLEELQNKPGD